MNTTYHITHEERVYLNAIYFMEQLRSRWPGIVADFPIEPNSPLLCFESSQDKSLKGYFTGRGICYNANSKEDIVEFALWYRRIVPVEWKLCLYDSMLQFGIILLTHEVTCEQIIAGFDIALEFQCSA